MIDSNKGEKNIISMKQKEKYSIDDDVNYHQLKYLQVIYQKENDKLKIQKKK